MARLLTIGLLSGLAFTAVGCATISGGGATSPVKKATEPTRPAFRRADIEGKLGADLDRLLGAPALTRVEGAGEYRRYTLAACSLIIILYPDQSGVKRAQHIDAAALDSGSAKPDVAACLAAGKPA